jgi:hypothetical protein
MLVTHTFAVSLAAGLASRSAVTCFLCHSRFSGVLYIYFVVIVCMRQAVEQAVMLDTVTEKENDISYVGTSVSATLTAV